MTGLQDRDTALRSSSQHAPRTHFFNSFFCNKLIIDSGKYDYKSVSVTGGGGGDVAEQLKWLVRSNGHLWHIRRMDKSCTHASRLRWLMYSTHSYLPA